MSEKTLEELAALTGGSVKGDGKALITGFSSLEDARPGDIAFAAEKKYFALAKGSKASAIIAAAEIEGVENLLLAANPQLAFVRAVEALSPSRRPEAGISPRAEVHPGASIGAGASIQSFCVVEEGAHVGASTVLYPGVYIGSGAKVGSACVLYQGVVIREGCVVGDRVIIHCNSVVGSDGFGYVRDRAAYVKVPQKGIVRIEDDVELGACVTVDRATMGETVIGRGTKIDNLVQIAHNVKIGEDTVIVAQAGIAGSARVGSRVQLGGQVGVAGHITIGDEVGVGAKSGVTGDLATRGVFSGMPAIPHGQWLRAQSVFSKLPELKKQIAELDRRLKELEEGQKGQKGQEG
jgi:UDP-3-O-[3-hydroxymyristoyl] glucosamine N-acyltransferase